MSEREIDALIRLLDDGDAEVYQQVQSRILTLGKEVIPMLESAWEHCELLDKLGFTRYCVSLKDSDPAKVIEVNRRFAEERPDVPLHLGVTEAGLPPDGIIKTRIAFEQLLSRGIGDTIRVSLTVPNSRKPEEIAAGRAIQLLIDEIDLLNVDLWNLRAAGPLEPLVEVPEEHAGADGSAGDGLDRTLRWRLAGFRQPRSPAE